MTRGRGGRPAKRAEGEWSTLTLRVSSDFKNHLLDVAEGYDMSLTEYLTTLVLRDAPRTDPAS